MPSAIPSPEGPNPLSGFVENGLALVFGPLWFLAKWAAWLLATAWAGGAVYFDGPFGPYEGNLWLALGWLGVTLVCTFAIHAPWTRAAAWSICMMVVVLPWLGLEPTNDRHWKPNWAQLTKVDLVDETFVFHNVRNFDHQTNGTAIERWETRRYRLSELRGVDLVLDAFGGDLVAHPMMSFDFGEDGHLVLSVETRREIDEDFSLFGGLYKYFELQYLWGDERDFVRLRSNIEKEPVYLYRLNASRQETFFMLLDSVRVTNHLAQRPRFYNVVSANCTTSLLSQSVEMRDAPFDYRLLANGRMDELMYEYGSLKHNGLPFDELRRRALINPAASAAHDAPDFSSRIRANRPGFADAD